MDGLAAAGSIVSLISILGQLAQSTRQLYDFWSSMKEVPRSLQWLVGDLYLIREILEVIESQLMQSIVPNIGNNSIGELLRKCILYIENLEALVKPLQSRPREGRGERTWKSIKAVFLTEKIKSYRENLESAKVTLLLVQSHISQSVEHY
jgi:hypothetical protein